MICYERDYHDATSAFDDRIELEEEILMVEEVDYEIHRDEEIFYRHLDEY